VVVELEEVTLKAKQILARPDEAYTHVLFPSAGVVSVLVPMGEEPSVEAGVIGYEGIVGIPLVLDGESGPHEVVVQVSDGGWRMPAARFKGLLLDCARLREVLQRYALTFMNQTARTLQHAGLIDYRWAEFACWIGGGWKRRPATTISKLSRNTNGPSPASGEPARSVDRADAQVLRGRPSDRYLTLIDTLRKARPVLARVSPRGQVMLQSRRSGRAYGARQ
jgi:hypothetical protein